MGSGLDTGVVSAPLPDITLHIQQMLLVKGKRVGDTDDAASGSECLARGDFDTYSAGS